MRNAEIAVLVLVAAILVLRAITRDRRDYARFKRMRSTAARRRMYRRWVIESVVLLGGLTVVVAFAVPDAVAGGALAQARAAPGVHALVSAFDGGLAAGLVVGIAAATLVLIALTIVVGRRTDELPAMGDVLALLPRNRAELGWGAALAVQAGIVEELLFRLALPSLIAVVTGSAIAGFAVAALLFGALHVYQGPAGMVAATVLGVVFTLLYLASGTILAPIALHLVIDLRSLVLLPVVVHRVHRVPA